MGKVGLRGVLGLSAMVAASVLLPPATATASTQIGATFTPDLGCGLPNTTLQALSPNGQYAAPQAGVLTSWSFQAPASPPQLKFKVGRPAGGNNFTIVGDSPVETMTPNALNTFPIRIPVLAGDVIGYFHGGPSGGDQCLRNAAPTFSTRFVNVDPAPGSTMTYGTVGALQVDMAALLEPDADQDAYGDESQDRCVGTAGTFSGCPSTVTLDRLQQKKRKPKLVVTATVPGAGLLTVGAGQSSLNSVTQAVTSAARQQFVLTLSLTKPAKRKLKNKGKLKLQVSVTYTPEGGPAASQTGKIKLRS